MALEPPDQRGAALTVPGQFAGGHDKPQTPPFAVGAAPLPPPNDPWRAQPAPRFPPPARHGRGAVISLVIVSVVAVLLLGVGGLFGWLWWSTDSELAETRAELNAEIERLSGVVDDRDGQIGRLDDELGRVRDELTDAETQLEGTENMVELLEDQQETIRQCILLLGRANSAFEDGDDSRGNDLLDEAETYCDEADEILGF